MLGRLLPKTHNFFALFEEHARLIVEACEAFSDLAEGGPDIERKVFRIKNIEHDADEVAHRCIEAVHKTFITPIDRYDIHNLIKRMDDIVDAVDATAARILMYEIKEIRSEAKDLACVLVSAGTELSHAIHGLRDMKNAAAITERCIEVHRLENEADALLRAALVRLFKEEDQAVVVIKWKEIYERLEKAADRCEEVANIIEGVVIEAT